jgi:hypothetical protein
MRRVLNQMNKIQELQNQISEIRSACKHDGTYTVGNWSWRPGTWYPSRICDNCAMAIEGLTQDELEMFQAGEAKRQRDWDKIHTGPKPE